MAKKGNRFRFSLKCTVCGAQAYTSTRNRINTTESLQINKFCSSCRKHQPFKEVK